MVENESAPRIGAAERAAAQRTLEAHLNSGRLSVSEYAERAPRRPRPSPRRS